MSRLVVERHGDGHPMYAVELQVDGELRDRTAWFDNPATAILEGERMKKVWRQEPMAA